MNESYLRFVAAEATEQLSAARREFVASLDEEFRPRFASSNDPATSAQAMEQLMRAWNPVSFQSGDLHRMAGEPSAAGIDYEDYRYDLGDAGVLWRFHLSRGGIILGVERLPME